MAACASKTAGLAWNLLLQAVHFEHLPARAPRYAVPSHPLSPQVEAAIAAKGVSRLFTHQAAAVDSVMSGRHTVVSTSTASGKSLCYNIPILEALAQDPRACAIYMFPTKALAQDQLRALRIMCEAAFGKKAPGVEVYDGDTAQSERSEVRDRAQLLITNPDMLHRSILPVHTQFSRVLAHLRHVVVDEGHAYKGVFGCHTALVLRRLRRLCHYQYHCSPTFVITSATVANPESHVQELLGVRDVNVVSDDGSPHGRKTFVLWNPPLTVSQLAKANSIPIVELSLLLAECIQHGLRTLAFCKTRKLCELVTAYTRETLKATSPHLARSISVYRAGYSPLERREIERALHDGDLWAVAATNALELGVDVGSLDVTLHLGFPGSVSSLWQQAGRAGRREQSSASIYIAFDGPLDQYFMTHPDRLFSRPIERAHVDAQNTQLLEQHVCCASAELPVILGQDAPFFGPKLERVMTSLHQQGLLGRHPQSVASELALHYVGPSDIPAAAVSLRAIDPERYSIVNEDQNGETIEEIEESKAFYEVYDGAVYMFQGRTYLCKKLDLASKVAVVRPADLKYYTKTRDFCDVDVTGGHAAYQQQASLGVISAVTTACCADADVTVRWMGFHRIWHGTGRVFDTVDLFLPDVSFSTQAAYIRVPRSTRQKVQDAGVPFRDGLHAASHSVLNVLPLFLMCDSSDMGSECDNPYDTRFRPERILIYDKHPGGIGLAEQATPLFGQLLEKALELVLNCTCTKSSGCPSCIQSADCGEYNAVLHKEAAVIVLQSTLEAEAEHFARMQLQATSGA
eukprot:jgi/Astpho2/9914/e_gw1.00152.3.1_t